MNSSGYSHLSFPTLDREDNSVPVQKTFHCSYVMNFENVKFYVQSLSLMFILKAWQPCKKYGMQCDTFILSQQKSVYILQSSCWHDILVYMSV